MQHLGEAPRDLLEEIQQLLDQAATLSKGMLQTSGASWYWYNDCGCNAPTAWGAYGVQVGGAPLVRDQVYRVVTNNFLAGGQDGWTTFAEGTNRWDTYYDMQEGFVEYINTGKALTIIFGILLVGVLASIRGGARDPVPLRSPFD